MDKVRRMSFRGGGGCSSGNRGSGTPEVDFHPAHGGSQSALGPAVSSPQGCDDVVLSGYLKKLKTGKRKFFVLHSGTPSGQPPTDGAGQPPAGNQYNQQARLEYFDSEKKWRAGADPKRSIELRSCFNINRKQDAKGRLLVALFTSTDCLLLQCATVQEHEEWLSKMQQLQQGCNHMLSDQRQSPHFDHIWEVCVKPKSLGTQQNLQGNQRICLTAQSLSLIRLERHRTTSNNSDHGGAAGDREFHPTVEFTLNSIRRCGHTDCFFFMELGRSSVTGAGELWMQTDDTVIARNMHEVILSAMKLSKTNDDHPRPRSNSTSETKPFTNVAIVHNHPVRDNHQNGPFYPRQPQSSSNIVSSFDVVRNRCDSMPAASRQNSEALLEQQGALLPRCNTIDCTQVGGRPWSAGSGSAGLPPMGHPICNSSLESCTEEPHTHGPTRSNLNLNVGSVTSPPPQSIVEEGGTAGDGMSEYLTMTSPCQHDGPGSLLGSPGTLTDGGPSSISSGHGAHPLPGPHSVTSDRLPGGSYFLPYQPSSASSSEYMRMSPSHDQPLAGSTNLNNNGGVGNSSAANSMSSNQINNLNNNVQDVMMGMVPPVTAPTTVGDTDAYMSMSPVSSQTVTSNNLLNNGTLPNGYVPMEPPSGLSSTMVISGSVPPLGAPGLRSGVRGISESSPISPPGYMEMAPLSSSLPKSVGALSGSWGSSIHSIHDPSPTFDLSVEGFQLDKVKSFIGDGDDDQSLRTGRSFSCGKRPSEQRNSSRSGLASGQGSERVRAYSVGSQANHPATLAAAAKRRQQQNQQQQQDALGTPTSDRGRSNSYSKKSSSTTTLGSRHSEEFMEINYDENWHRATASASAMAAMVPPSLQSATSLQPSANLNNSGSNTNNNNKDSSEYLPMMRVPNYKQEPESSMKLFPLKEVEITPSPKECATFQDKHRFGSAHSSNAPTTSTHTAHTNAIGKTAHSEYMDLSGQSNPQSGPKSLASASHNHNRSLSSDADGEYVSLDMSRPWQTRPGLSLCGAPEPKKCRSELTHASMSFDVTMTPTSSSSPPPPPSVVPAATLSPSLPSPSGTMLTTHHNYENLSFGANGATVDVISSSQDSQEPMDTDQPNTKPPPPTPASSPTPESVASSMAASTHIGPAAALLGQSVSPPSTPIPSPGIPMQVVPGSGHELNYASLDLPQASDEPSSPSGVHETGGTSHGAGIVPPSLGLANAVGLPNTTASGSVSYSEVDFRKSEGLRGSMLREGGRV